MKSRILLAVSLLSILGGTALLLQPGSKVSADEGLKARVFEMRTYTTADGLASLRAEHITEDHDGYLWFATDGGVSRFDGSPSQQPHALAEG